MNAIFITARTGSSRLPKKMLLKIEGRPVIEHVIERMKRSKRANLIVLCTTELPDDSVLCYLALRNGISFHRGSVEDKLERWRGAAKKYGVEFFVTCDGDDLFCDPELIDMAFEQYEKNHPDLIECRETPCGAFTYGIGMNALDRVCAMKGTTDTEMIRGYFDGFNVEQLADVPDDLKRPDIRMTLDYPDDLVFFKCVFKHFADRQFTLREVIQFIEKNPAVGEINRYLQDRFLENQRKKARVILKSATA